MSIRRASKDDVPQIRDISKSATATFASIPELAELAQDEETPEEIQHWLHVGRVYIVEESNQAVGFVAAYPMDEVLYVAEMSVHVSHQRKGIGGVLLTAVWEWSLERSKINDADTARVSLTTYVDVPWNAPFYSKYGFREVQPEKLGAEHVSMFEQDVRKLTRPGYRRCCMLRESKG